MFLGNEQGAVNPLAPFETFYTGPEGEKVISSLRFDPEIELFRRLDVIPALKTRRMVEIGTTANFPVSCSIEDWQNDTKREIKVRKNKVTADHTQVAVQYFPSEGNVKAKNVPYISGFYWPGGNLEYLDFVIDTSGRRTLFGIDFSNEILEQGGDFCLQVKTSDTRAPDVLKGVFDEDYRWLDWMFSFKKLNGELGNTYKLKIQQALNPNESIRIKFPSDLPIDDIIGKAFSSIYSGEFDTKWREVIQLVDSNFTPVQSATS